MTSHSEEALRMWARGKDPNFSHNIAGQLTAGYGKIDENGDWEFPLPNPQHYLDELRLERM